LGCHLKKNDEILCEVGVVDVGKRLFKDDDVFGGDGIGAADERPEVNFELVVKFNVEGVFHGEML